MKPRRDYRTANYDRLLRDQKPLARNGSQGKTWTIGQTTVSVMKREDAGIDGDEPWIASCDTHGEMIACPTKAIAVESAKHRDWCYGCTTATHDDNLT